MKKEKTDNLIQAKIEKMHEELNQETKETEELKQEMIILTEKIQKINDDLIINKEKLEEEYDNIIGHKETLKTDTEIQELEMQAVKDNILHVSGQLNSLKELSNHYNQTIEKINEKIELVNKRYYETKITAENASEMKEKIIKNMQDNIENEKYSIKISKKLGKITSFFEKKEEELKIINEIDEKIQSALNLVEHFQKEDSASQLEKIIRSFENPTEKLNRKPKVKKDLNKTLLVSYFNKMNELKLKELELSTKEKLNPLKEAQIAELNDKVLLDVDIFNGKIEYLKKQLDFYKNQNNLIQGKNEEITIE